MIDYKDKTVLVTGAASGIGEALAYALADRGARVICTDVDSAGVESVVENIARGAQAIACDLADPQVAAQLVDQAYGISGQLDLICSNAGIGHRSKLLDEPFDGDTALAKLFEINFFAGLKIAQAYARRLGEGSQRGRLMVTASENSLSIPQAVKTSRLPFYGASKHALLVAMEWLKIEQQKGPLDLHVLLPGAIYTPMISARLPDPSAAPPELELIMPKQCAEIALKGMDLNLFYIPTQAHLLDDMQPRVDGVQASLRALGITKTY